MDPWVGAGDGIGERWIPGGPAWPSCPGPVFVTLLVTWVQNAGLWRFVVNKLKYLV